MQLPGGAIGWALRPDGTPDDTALLTGNASLLPGAALRHRAGRAASARPSRTGSSPSPTSATALRERPEAFADRSRYSMDWYYPVLGGAVTGAAAPRPAGRRLGHVRRPRAGRALRRRPAVGDRRGDLRAGARAGRRRPARRRDRAGRRDAAPPRRRRLLLDRAGLRRRRPLAGRAHHLDGGRRGARRGRDRRHRPRPPACSPTRPPSTGPPPPVHRCSTPRPTPRPGRG